MFFFKSLQPFTDFFSLFLFQEDILITVHKGLWLCVLTFGGSSGCVKKYKGKWARLETLITEGRLIKLLYSVDHEILGFFVLRMFYVVLAYMVITVMETTGSFLHVSHSSCPASVSACHVHHVHIH